MKLVNKVVGRIPSPDSSVVEVVANRSKEDRGC